MRRRRGGKCGGREGVRVEGGRGEKEGKEEDEEVELRVGGREGGRSMRRKGTRWRRRKM